MKRSSFPTLTLVLLLVAGSCGPPEVTNEAVGEAAPPPTRPSDGLLSNPALQEVVDLQVERDGACLTTLLRSPDAAIRARAAFALASVQDPEAGSALTGLLSDPDPEVRRDAAFALGQLSDPIYGAALVGALRDETDEAVRLRLLEAAGKVGDGRVLEALLALDLPPDEAPARNLAVSRIGLRGITLPTGISHLLSEMATGSDGARENAAYYFGRNPDPTPWAASAAAVRSVLDSLPPSDPAAMHLLSGIALLGAEGDNPRFMAWMRGSPDWRIRTNAVRGATGRTASLRIRERLLEALDEPSSHVAMSAADALAGVRQLQATEVEALKEWVRENPREWRRGGPVLAVLGRMGEGELILDWLEGWTEADIIPRTRGIGALAFVPTAEAREELMALAASPESRIRGTALGALSRRWRAEAKDPATVARYLDVFSQGLRTRDPSATVVSAPALADSAFLPLGSLVVLMNEYRNLSASEDLGTMRAILRALGATGTPEAQEFLEREVRATEGTLRSTAEAALAAMAEEEEGGEEGGGEEEIPEEVQEVTPAERHVDWDALANLGPRPRLILETEKGMVTLVMDAESAPLTVQTIAGFAEEGLYDGTSFHRVVANFVIQGGDFSRKEGAGGPDFSIRSEFTQIPYRRGVLGMASAGKDTEGSQFFITHSMAPHLDGGYTAFGWVESGMDVVDVLYVEDRVVTARVEPAGS